MSKYVGLAVVVGALGFARASWAAGPPPTTAGATIVDATGRAVGAAILRTLPSGATQVSVTVAGFDPGPGGDHGVHIHATGTCAEPEFTSAAGHHNPDKKQHGTANPSGPHAGDLPNIQFLPDGSGSLVTTTTAFKVADLLDADGSAIMIHAGSDDGVTDPSGNSGARIGCGVIAVTSTAGPSAAVAAIRDAAGRVVGSAVATSLASGNTRFDVTVSDFLAAATGDHGVHVHSVGNCTASDFVSAGGHLNPGQKLHGLLSAAGPHGGDLPNLQVLPGGNATLTAVTSVSLAQLLDSDGSAIVVHAGPDDGTSDPSGNSGARIGCGVFVPQDAAP